MSNEGKQITDFFGTNKSSQLDSAADHLYGMKPSILISTWHTAIELRNNQSLQKSISNFRLLSFFFLRNGWTNTKHVCTHFNAVYMLIPNMVILFTNFDNKKIKNKYAIWNFSGHRRRPPTWNGLLMGKWHGLQL